MSKLSFIFVHGLPGWGNYDPAYQRMPCWGMRGGDLMVFYGSRALIAMQLPLRPPAAHGIVPASYMRSWRGRGWITEKRTVKSIAMTDLAGTFPRVL